MTEPLTRPTWPIALHFNHNVTLVRLRGEYRQGCAVDVDALAGALAATGLPVVVNVSAVTEMDISGLRWMMRLTRQARGRGESLILESPTPCVEAVLTLTGCHTWFSAATRPGPHGRTDTARLISALSA